MTIDPETLDRWQAVCDAATAGPWTFYEFGEGGRVVSIPKGQKDRVSRCIEERRMRLCDCCPATALHWVFAKHDEQEVSNLKFIALARTALPLAIAALRERAWRPIESAPKDGRSFVVGMENVSSGMAHYDDGLFVLEAGSRDLYDATHFQPLPAPPQQEGEG